MKSLKLSAVALALMASGIANAVDYTTYNSITENIQRTKGYVTQDEYDSGSYKYPESTYGSVSFLMREDGRDLKSPHEAIISLGAGTHSAIKNLAIPTGTTFTLNNSFPSSTAIQLIGSGLKFHDGAIKLGYAYQNGNDNDGGNTAIYGDSATIDVSNVSILSTSDTPSTAYLLVNSHNVSVNNSTITLSSKDDADLGLFGFDLENSTVTADKLNLTLSPESAGVGFVVAENSTLNLSNSTVTLNGGDNSFASSAVQTIQSNVNIDNSTITTSSNAVAFSNGFVTNLFKSGGETVVNLTNSTVTSGKGLIALNTDSNLEDGETDNSSSIPFILNTDNSTLSGNVTQNASYATDITLNLTNGSKWSITSNSNVTNLNVDNSVVNVNSSSQYNTLTIGNLTGNGTFNLRTDLANENSDQIVVTGTDKGTHSLAVQDSGNEPNAANGSVTLVKTQTGTAIFNLANKDYVDAGAYRYRLRKSGTNWVLSNLESESSSSTSGDSSATTDSSAITDSSATTNGISTPENTATTDTTSNADATTTTNSDSSASSSITTNSPNLKALSGYTNALVSLRQSQLLQTEQNLANLQQRLGDLRNGEQVGVWALNQNERYKFASTETASDSRTSGFKQDYHSLQVGSDVALGNTRVGGFVGTSQSNVNFNGEYGSGKVKSRFAGLYATLLLDNGFYWDNIYKYERTNLTANVIDEQHYNAHTLATEIGQKIQFGDDWSITPKAQFAWTHISGNENVEKLTALYTRAGARLAKVFTIGAWKWQPYAEVNGVFSKNNDSQVNVNGYKFDVANSKARVETALGLNLGVASHNFGLQLSQANGKNVDQSFAAEVVYRYEW